MFEFGRVGRADNGLTPRSKFISPQERMNDSSSALHYWDKELKDV